MRRKEDSPRTVDCPYRELAISIVIQAVEDWRLFIYDPYAQSNRYNFEELRKFFKSQWCEFLLECTSASPIKILEILEGELYDSRFRG